jgi:uncharacterized membrane protein
MKTTLKVTMGAVTLAFAASLVAYPWLPPTVPVHFDLAGHPNGFASRSTGAFLLPAVMLIPLVVDLARRGANEAVGTVTAILSVFLLSLHVVALRAALTAASPGGALWLVLGISFVALGLALPRVRRNRWVGFRTPWAMSSPEAWARSQRAGGYAMVLGGALLALSSVSNGAVALALRVLAIVGMTFVPAVYSYFAARATS